MHPTQQQQSNRRRCIGYKLTVDTINGHMEKRLIISDEFLPSRPSGRGVEDETPQIRSAPCVKRSSIVKSRIKVLKTFIQFTFVFRRCVL
jgi:hypothetical protein